MPPRRQLLIASQHMTRLLRRITYLFICGWVLLATLIIASDLVMLGESAQQENDSEIVDQSGRQRMLGERLRATSTGIALDVAQLAPLNGPFLVAARSYPSHPYLCRRLSCAQRRPSQRWWSRKRPSSPRHLRSGGRFTTRCARATRRWEWLTRRLATMVRAASCCAGLPSVATSSFSGEIRSLAVVLTRLVPRFVFFPFAVQCAICTGTWTSI
jgi:hypothetical protein